MKTLPVKLEKLIDEGVWDPGASFILKCYNYTDSGWEFITQYNLHDTSERWEIYAQLTPSELDSCILVPNMDAYQWGDSIKYDVISRVRNNCLNSDSTARKILNNNFIPIYSEDIKTDISEYEEQQIEIQMNDIDPYNTINILHSSKHKMKSINDGEKNFYWIYKKGTVYGTPLHTLDPWRLPIYYFNEQEDPEEAIKEWCFNQTKCDGISQDPYGTWFPFSFDIGSFELRSIENYNSWIKSTSLDDDCESYSSQKLVKPHKIHSSIQGIDLISSTVISSSQKITFQRDKRALYNTTDYKTKYLSRKVNHIP